MNRLYIWSDLPYVMDSYHNHAGSVIAIAPSRLEAALLADQAMGEVEEYDYRAGEKVVSTEKRLLRLMAMLHDERTCERRERLDDDPNWRLCVCEELDYDVELTVVELDAGLRYARGFENRGCC